MDETQRQFKTVALAAGTLNLGVEDTQGVFRALEQILSKGKVQSEELRGQLGDRLPGAFAIAAKAMGMTTAALSDMMKEGKVLSTDFVPKFITALQAAYNIDPTANIDSTQASINRLTNGTTFMYEAFAKSTGVVTTFKAILAESHP
jgi:tape measure domain-containing protein